MFGYLSACRELLSEEEEKRYRAVYCGLCRSLQERHGELSRLTLSYDMCFLVLLLGSLYEPEEQAREQSCLLHPREKRLWLRSEASDYAADMTVALAYLKCLDDWRDEGNPAALAEAGVLRKAYLHVKEQYPRQCGAMEKAIQALGEVERRSLDTPDEAAECFAGLMGEVFVWREDRWRSTLYRMGSALGRFVYLLDACMDLDSDMLWNRYNPFRRYYGQKNRERFRELLKMLLADCVWEMDRLPLVQDIGLLRNILCAGLWTEFYKKYGSEEGTADGSGSV